MRPRILFILKYWLCWIILFEVARLFFYLCNPGLTKTVPISDIFRSLWYGASMDMSMAAYITLPAGLFVLAGIFLSFFQKPTIYKIYTGIVLFFVLLLIGTDINIYKAWGYRIDASPLKYLSNPKEAWASVSNLPLIWILLGFLAAFLSTLFFFNKFIRRDLSKMKIASPQWLQALVLLLLLATFIIPIRGGFQLAPLNQSTVYFSSSNFVNQASINAPWNFMHSLSHNTESKSNPFLYVAPKDAEAIRDSLFASGAQTDSILQIKSGIKTNVIFIVWESFTEKATHLRQGGIDITPRFNELKREGIYFSNLYASGDRTDKGIVAVLSGYPAQPTTSIVKIPVKASKLPMLSKELAANGYNTSFYYGGELEFANMKAYLLGGNFKKYTSKDDFDEKDQNSKWGAHDGVVMQKVIDGLNKETSPFFCTWLTLSSHEPFETPLAPVIKGSDDVSLFLNSLHYTDQVVYDFIKQAQKQPWWANTLLVITADHGHRLPHTGKKIDDFKIPVLFLGGALRETGITKTNTASQVDIAATILTQLGLPSKKFVWSRNMLDKQAPQWAYFCFNNGYGFVQPGNYFIFDNIGKKAIETSGILSSTDTAKGKTIQQLSFGDYLSK
ncbi:LTA synthase family protein [Ferruginibacter sp. HRS2-29]|uniref:LTA synthase family protein n=1 Tax=Ferruginibacter sp. HRS2-29 TaxID=2487334 RepID=UPI0020CBB5FE|nr:alkaline phosphatase family protein [Ferruginibacter sp. HRS2-29]MCP9752597.1 alkaline phosphatase family protein [Ferruginibacter sp. HRS2-29]